MKEEKAVNKEDVEPGDVVKKPCKHCNMITSHKVKKGRVNPKKLYTSCIPCGRFEVIE